MPDSPSSKTQLRQQLRQQRRALSRELQIQEAIAAATLAPQLDNWPDTRRIAVYMANDGELETGPLAALCREADKMLFLPVIGDNNLLAFAHWSGEDQLEPNHYGIPEPSSDAPRCAAPELDIIFLPLVGWDKTGGRLGMGGGYYDRTLAGLDRGAPGIGPLLVGLGYALQEVARIPRDDWDVTMDYVMTSRGLHDCRRIR